MNRSWSRFYRLHNTAQRDRYRAHYAGTLFKQKKLLKQIHWNLYKIYSTDTGMFFLLQICVKSGSGEKILISIQICHLGTVGKSIMFEKRFQSIIDQLRLKDFKTSLSLLVSSPETSMEEMKAIMQCCGSGSAWIQNFCLDPDPELLFRIQLNMKEQISKNVISL